VRFRGWTGHASLTKEISRRFNRDLIAGLGMALILFAGLTRTPRPEAYRRPARTDGGAGAAVVSRKRKICTGSGEGEARGKGKGKGKGEGKGKGTGPDPVPDSDVEVRRSGRTVHHHHHHTHPQRPPGLALAPALRPCALAAV
jgi:hypothetical protein